MSDDQHALRADIDATGEIEDAMVDAARRLVDEHGYSIQDLVNVLESTLGEEIE